MTFPSSPFPRTEFDGTPCTTYRPNKMYKSIGLPRCECCESWVCVLPYYAWEARSGGYYHQDCSPHDPPRDFPILRSKPLWQQTWVHHGQSPKRGVSGWGAWFPPLKCTVNECRRCLAGFHGPRDTTQWRLYSSPRCRCTTCLDNAQAVEIMLQGIGWAVRQWPDQWEHRCWWERADRNRHVERRACVCRNRHSLTNWQIWGEVEVADFAEFNRRARARGALREIVGGISTARMDSPRVEQINVSQGMLRRIYYDIDDANEDLEPVSAYQHAGATNGWVMSIAGVPVHRDFALPEEDWTLVYDDGIVVHIPSRLGSCTTP